MAWILSFSTRFWRPPFPTGMSSAAWKHGWFDSNVGPPQQCERWFINPMNTIVRGCYRYHSYHSYWSYLHQISYLGSRHCGQWQIWMCLDVLISFSRIPDTSCDFGLKDFERTSVSLSGQCIRGIHSRGRQFLQLLGPVTGFNRIYAINKH